MNNNYRDTINSIIFYINKGIKNGTLKINNNGMIESIDQTKESSSILGESFIDNAVIKKENISENCPKNIFQNSEKNDIYNKKISEWMEDDKQNLCEYYEHKYDIGDYYQDNSKPQKYIESKDIKSKDIKSKNIKSNYKKSYTNIVTSQEININCFKRFNIYNEQREVVTNKTELLSGKKINFSLLVKGSKNILAFSGTSINKRDADLTTKNKTIIYDTKNNISSLPILIPDKSIKLPIRVNIGDGKLVQLLFTNTKKYYINLNENDTPKNITIYLISSYKDSDFAIKTSFKIWSIKVIENSELKWNIHANLLPK